MFKDFDTKPFEQMKPPGDNTFDTMQEIKELKSIPINKKFVKDHDNIESAFKKVAEENDIKNYDPKLAKDLIEKSAPLIMKLKNKFNRPRPKSIAKKMNIKMKDIEMKSMKTPSYPSGHSVQGMLIGSTLAKKYPKAKSAFIKKGKDISYSRRVAHAHYKSDSKMGEQLGNSMFKHIKNKI